MERSAHTVLSGARASDLPSSVGGRVGKWTVVLKQFFLDAEVLELAPNGGAWEAVLIQRSPASES
jgi:hypothetical protein